MALVCVISANSGSFRAHCVKFTFAISSPDELICCSTYVSLQMVTIIWETESYWLPQMRAKSGCNQVQRSQRSWMGHSPYNGSLGADPVVRGQGVFAAWAESFLALECPMEAAILAILGILHTWKTASLTHLVSWSPASHSCQNYENAAAPAFLSEGQITTGTPFLLKSICRNGVPAPLHPCILVKDDMQLFFWLWK